MSYWLLQSQCRIIIFRERVRIRTRDFVVWAYCELNGRTSNCIIVTRSCWKREEYRQYWQYWHVVIISVRRLGLTLHLKQNGQVVASSNPLAQSINFNSTVREAATGLLFFPWSNNLSSNSSLVHRGLKGNERIAAGDSPTELSDCVRDLCVKYLTQEKFITCLILSPCTGIT